MAPSAAPCQMPARLSRLREGRCPGAHRELTRRPPRARRRRKSAQAAAAYSLTTPYSPSAVHRAYYTLTWSSKRIFAIPVVDCRACTLPSLSLAGRRRRCWSHCPRIFIFPASASRILSFPAPALQSRESARETAEPAPMSADELKARLVADCACARCAALVFRTYAIVAAGQGQRGFQCRRL